MMAASSHVIHRICAAAYVAFLLLASVTAYRTTDRDWNWDGLAYMACVISWSEPDPATLHAKVYREAQQAMPAAAFQALAASNAYRSDLAGNSFHFVEQLPFYDGRVLYLALIAALHHAGATYIGAMKAVAAAGFFVLGLLFFLWTWTYFPAAPAAILSAAFMLSSPVWSLARIFSPDALSVAIIIGGLYALFVVAPSRSANARSRIALLGLALLTMAVFVRNDTLLLAVLVTGYLALATRSPVRLPRAHAAILTGGLIVALLGFAHLGGSYGWRMSVYHGLVQRVPAPAEITAPGLTATDYLRAAARSAREAVGWTSLPLFAFLTVLCLLVLKRGTLMRDLLLLNLAFSLVRILAYPGFEERYYVSTYVVVTICVISAIANPASRPRLTAPVTVP